jgi:hypothetical protein
LAVGLDFLTLLDKHNIFVAKQARKNIQGFAFLPVSIACTDIIYFPAKSETNIKHNLYFSYVIYKRSHEIE